VIRQIRVVKPATEASQNRSPISDDYLCWITTERQCVVKWLYASQ